MDIVNQHLDFLQNVEHMIVTAAEKDPSITDKEVMKALDRLNKYYQRKKKKMPELESTLTGGAKMVFDYTYGICELRRKKEPGENKPDTNQGFGGDLPLNVIIAGISRLEDSAKFWNKEKGAKGYLNYIRQFVK